jgi:hypothetical protein
LAAISKEWSFTILMKGSAVGHAINRSFENKGGDTMEKHPSKRQFQQDLGQYNMDNVINAPKNYVYRVGYEASSGNPTGNHDEAKKTRELQE